MNIYVCDGVSECVHTEQAVFRALCFFTYGGFRVLACVAALRGGVGTERGGERGGGGAGYLSAEVDVVNSSISKYIGINHVGQSVNSLCDSET